MKNIYLIPTDKPSRLFLNKVNNKLLLDSDTYSNLEKILPSSKYQNIYITNDEEIKEGDWYYLPRTISVYKCIEDPIELNLEKRFGVAKIILTTDQELIKDGVQKIDDEFLEWFVNNLSCETVEVVKDKKLSSKSIYDAVEGDLVYSNHGYGGVINSLSKDVRVGIDNYIEIAITSETGWETLDINNYRIYDKCYKIIIPKEEPKQEVLEEAKQRAVNYMSLKGALEPKQTTEFEVLHSWKEKVRELEQFKKK